MAVGRVCPQLQLDFAARYGFSFDGRHYEAFEIEVQEGACDVEPIMDLVNDAPVSRLWLSLCARGAVTVCAGAPFTLAQVRSRAPGELQLVSRLQG